MILKIWANEIPSNGQKYAWEYQMATDEAGEIFAVNLAAVAREIAMDILPINQILKLHQIDDPTWMLIQEHQKFQQMLQDMTQEWQTASNVRERVKAKAGTGLETQLDVYIAAIGDKDIPLTQRVEAGKFLATLGEMIGKEFLGGAGGNAFQINLNIGTTSVDSQVRPPLRVIDGEVVKGAIPE